MSVGRDTSGFAQDQFLEVIDRDEAERRFQAVLELRPLGDEIVPLDRALGRVLAHDVSAPVDVPLFDRSDVDGYALRAADTFGAMEERPRRLQINWETLRTGVIPRVEVQPGTASVIATGAVVPRGADAVVMVEYTDLDGDQVKVFRPVAPGASITFAGSDIGRGEIIMRRGELLSSRETGVLAALGIAQLAVFRRPRVAVISTGDELIAPGDAVRPGLVYDSNSTIVGDAVRELGGEPVVLGIVRDDESQLRVVIEQALDCDVVVLSGGTSKGAGDLSYRVVRALPPPVAGQPAQVRPSPVLAHGVALKPGKPICLAASRVDSKCRNVPVVILPGFPTSAIFTFYEFVAPVIRAYAGLPRESVRGIPARLPLSVNSERGRTEYLLVGLVDGPSGLSAYPMGKGSGSVTAFSRADGFVTIPREQEQVDQDTIVTVQPLARSIQPAGLVAIGSHCAGLDLILGELHARGFRVKSMAIGSTAGLVAARRGECDVAGVHLLDPVTGAYNQPFVSAGLQLVKGYTRMQGLVYRSRDSRFEGKSLHQALNDARADPECRMVNRNRGSGTRVLIDRLLTAETAAPAQQPAGYYVEVKSHNAVVAAVAQGRADWGIAIETVAREAGLAFVPLREEEFDFAIPAARLERPGVQALLQVLTDPATHELLVQHGFRPHASMGRAVAVWS
jgi:putative molybdopterin biosynthesis protein